MTYNPDMEKFLTECIVNRAIDTGNIGLFNIVSEKGVNILEEPDRTETNIENIRQILKGYVEDIDDNLAIYLMGFVRKKAHEILIQKNKGR